MWEANNMLKPTVLENSCSSLWLQPQHHKQQLINHGDETGGDGVVLLCTNTHSGKSDVPGTELAGWGHLLIGNHTQSHLAPSLTPDLKGLASCGTKLPAWEVQKKFASTWWNPGLAGWPFLKHNHEAAGGGYGCLTEQFTDLPHQNTPIQTLENLKGLKRTHTLCRTCSKSIHLSGQQRLALKYMVKCHNHDLMEASIWREENGFLQINYIGKTDYL